MSKKVIVYSTTYCPFCNLAKQLFEEKGADLEIIDLTNDHEKRAEISAKTGWMTVPMVFIGDEFIGGFDECAQLEAKGELDQKLAE